MKKRLIPLIALFISFISVAAASWMIMKPSNVQPPVEYFPFEIDAEYASYYNGEYQDIAVKYEDNASNDELTFSYSQYFSNNNSLLLMNEKPIYPGVYLVEVIKTYEKQIETEQGTSFEEVNEVISTVKFEILRRPVRVEAKEVSIYFGQKATAVELEYEIEKAVEGSNSGLIEGDVLETDNVEVSVEYNLYDDCGKYDYIIKGLSNSNYEITYEIEDKFIVEQLEIGFKWAANPFKEYNGQYQLPDVESYYLTGACSNLTDVNVNEAIANQQFKLNYNTTNELGEVNADKYNVACSSATNDNNIVLVTNPGAVLFEITPKEIDLTWNTSTYLASGVSKNGFEYDGQYHYETANINTEQLCVNVLTDSIDACVIEYANEIGNIDASTYTSTITALSNSNYAIKSISNGNENNSYNKDYTIHPKGINLTWNTSTYMFNGVNKNGFEFDGNYHYETAVINVGQLCQNVKTNRLDECLIEYENELGNIDASTYVSIITSLSNSNYFINSISEGNSNNPYAKNYTINQRVITLTWDEALPSEGYYYYVFDASSHMPTAEASNYITTRADGKTENLGFNYDNTPKINANYCNITDEFTITGADKYYSTVTITSRNHKLPDNYSYEYKIIQKEVGITWSETENIYAGKTKVILPVATINSKDVPAKELVGKTANEAVGLSLTGGQTNVNYRYDYDNNQYVKLEGSNYNYVATATLLNTNYKYKVEQASTPQSRSSITTTETITLYTATTTFSILPKSVAVSFDSYGISNPSTGSNNYDETIYFIYNAQDYIPTVSVNQEDVYDNEVLKVSIELLNTKDQLLSSLRNVGLYYGKTVDVNNLNYRIEEIQNAEITIAPAPVIIKWQDNLELEYNSKVQLPTASIVSGVYSVDMPYLYVETEGENTSANAYKDGRVFGNTYLSNIIYDENGDYVLSSSNEVLVKNYYIENTDDCEIEYVIKQVELKVNALPETIIYGDAPNKTPLLVSNSINTANIQIEGLQENDTINVLTGLSRYVTYNQYDNVTGLENASYKSSWQGVTNTNYYYTYNEATYTVNPKPVELSWDYSRLVYNNQSQSALATVTNLARSIDSCVVTVDEYINAGKDYISNALSLSNGNYTLVNGQNLTSAKYEIEQRPLCIKWGSLNLTYASSVAELFPSYSIINLANGHEEATLNLAVNGINTFANYNSLGRISNNDYYASLILNNDNYRWATASDLNIDEYGIKDQDASYVDNNSNIEYKIYALEINVEWNSVDFTYNGSHLEPTIKSILRADDSQNGIYSVDSTKVLFGSDQISVTSDSSVQNFIAGTWAGKHYANLALAGELASNYEIVDGDVNEYIIKQKPLTVSAKDKDYILYGEAVSAEGYGYEIDSSNSFVQGESFATYGKTVTYSYDGYNVKSNVGTYDITINEIELNNYIITYIDGTLTVNKRPITVTANNNIVLYGNAAESAGYVADGLVNDETLESLNVSLGYTFGNYAVTSNAGTTYKISINDFTLDNYDVTLLNGTLTVNKRPITITAKDNSVYYGNAGANNGYEITEGNFVNDQSLDSLGITLGYTYSTYSVKSNAGSTHNININAFTLDNYDVTLLNGTLSVDQRPITITAKNNTVYYGNNAEGNGYEVSGMGLVNDETLESLNVSLGYTFGNYAVTSNAGTTHNISINTFTLDNYAITLATGTLTVNQRPITVTANNNSIYYGNSEAINANQYVVTGQGMANGEVLDELVTLSYNYVDYAVTSNAGNTHNIVISEFTLSNYEITLVNGTLTVAKRPITITVKESNVTYGDAAQGNGYEVTSELGFVNNESLETLLTSGIQYVINGKPLNEYDLKIKAGEYVEYISIPNTSTLTNYDITLVNGKLIVNKRNIIITAKDNNIVYGNTVANNSDGYIVSGEGFVNGENLDILGVTVTYLYEGYTTRSTAGSTYDISVDSFTLDNYEVAYGYGKLTVEKRKLTITPKNNLVYTAKQYVPIEISGYANDDTYEDLGIQLNKYATNVATLSDVKITGISNTNYYISEENMDIGTVIISPKEITIPTKPTLYYMAQGDEELYINSSSAQIDGNISGDAIGVDFSIIGTYNMSDYKYKGEKSTYTEDSYKLNLSVLLTGSSSDNYIYTGGNITVNVIVAAVAEIDGTYYGTVYEAIEDANVIGSKVVVRIVSTLPEDYKYVIPTLRTPDGIKEVTINYGVTLLVPFADGNEDSIQTEGNVTSHNIYSKLLIPEGVEMLLNGKLSAGADIHATGALGNYGVIRNDGIIKAKNAEINAYGYIKGTGEIHLENSLVNDVFTMYDWPGGINGFGLINNSIIPFQSYSIHNNSCKTIIDSQSQYTALIMIEITLLGLVPKVLTVIGDTAVDSKVGLLFKLNSGYLIKSVDTPLNEFDDFNSNFEKTNQSQYQREVFEIFGNITDGSVRISHSTTILVAPVGIDISTGVDIAMPIGFMDIRFEEGTSTLSTNSYKFLPGSSLFVKEGATLNIEKINMIFYETYLEEYKYTPPADQQGNTHPTYNGMQNEHFGYMFKHADWFNSGREDIGAQFIIAGNVYCSNNGSIGCNGGTIKGKDKGKIAIATESASMKEITSLTYKAIDTSNLGGVVQDYMNGTLGSSVESKNVTYYPSGIINNANSKFEKGVTYTYNNIKKTWGTEITVSYVNNSTEHEDFTLLISGGSAGCTPSSEMLEISRDYYHDVEWYTDATFTNKYNGEELFTSTTLYAKWTPIIYNIQYELENYAEGTDIPDNAEIVNNNASSFNVQSNSLLLTTPTHSLAQKGYMFGGWYYDEGCTEQVLNGELSLAKLEQLSASGTETVKLYAQWFNDSINATYVNDGNSDYNDELETFIKTNGSIIPAAITPFKNFTLPFKVNDNDNIAYNKYFAGWYVDTDATNDTVYDTLYSDLTDSQINELLEAKSITLYAKWIEKVVVTTSVGNDSAINAGYKINGLVSITQYYMLSDLSSYKVPTDSSFTTANNNKAFAYYLDGWYVGSTKVKDGELTSSMVSNNTITVTGKWESKVVVITNIGENAPTSATVKGGRSVTEYYMKEQLSTYVITDNYISINEDITISYYFDNWYVGSSKLGTLSESQAVDGVITVTGKWLAKVTVTFKISGDISTFTYKGNSYNGNNKTYYLIAGDKFEISGKYSTRWTKYSPTCTGITENITKNDSNFLGTSYTFEGTFTINSGVTTASITFSN